MIIIELKNIEGTANDPTSISFRKLLSELRKKVLPPEIIESVNQDIEEINTTSFTGNALRKLIRKKQEKIIKLLKKELKIVPKHYYRGYWIITGMIMGMPVGMVGLFYNAGLFGVGMLVGMLIGLIIGWQMDKKAAKAGRQLDGVIY